MTVNLLFCLCVLKQTVSTMIPSPQHTLQRTLDWEPGKPVLIQYASNKRDRLIPCHQGTRIPGSTDPAAPEKERAKQSRQGPPRCHAEPLEHALLKAATCQALGRERGLCCSASQTGRDTVIYSLLWRTGCCLSSWACKGQHQKARQPLAVRWFFRPESMRGLASQNN